jgi:large subunit ribosomal protein L4
MEAIVYNVSGAKKGSTQLPDEVFGLSWNPDLVHQVVTSELANKRVSIAHTKGRGEVRGGGKKPWRQKGTGRARHGSIRSPIWIGGGTTHGPRAEKDYSKKINRKMRTKALFTVLSKKLADNEIMFIDSLAVLDGKTKTARDIVLNLSKVQGFERLAKKKKNAALFTLSKSDAKVEAKRGFKNIVSVGTGEIENLNVLDALSHTYLIISNPEQSLAFLKSKQK